MSNGRRISGFESIWRNASANAADAKAHLEDLKKETEIHFLYRSWFGLLESYKDATAAIKRATSIGPSSAWSSRIYREQKENPFLHYAFHARNERSHRMEKPHALGSNWVSIGGAKNVSTVSNDRLKRQRGNIVINVPMRISTEKHSIIQGASVTRPEGGTEFIDYLDARRTGYHGEMRNTDIVRYESPYLKLSAIKTREGNEIQVPNVSTPPEKQAIEIAEYICEWLDQKMVEARGELGIT